ncbi:GMC family oxidoreductase N-terminal domain-containing protein [Microbacterium sp. HD4P20]|uniref:GMC family oxidoreductase n=1 Tax=Microbacterium sp. HD4P20 TaxID=2864874 RepID=UPI001C63C28A|nr:GMC family oxidoreductase N-terminal domain-containing protein [Microbacterium sp. HD4P20]MCP2636314.1 GMC family oxidoreductase N-terminal domain-containing protein [Microbacterium sp. HD4P20]
MSTRRIVVVGAGGSGIPLAARLGALGHAVTLLEAGPLRAALGDSEAEHGLEHAWTVREGLPGGALTWTYDAELFTGRPWRIARGRLLGGSTSVNGAYFQRPHPDDFAGWAAVAGPEWSYDACLPALRRLESDRDFGGDAVHGTTGPMPVERTGGSERVTSAFLDAALATGARPETDKNAGGPSGAGLLPRNAVGPARWGVARAYESLLAAASVEIRAGALVRRIVFRGDAAVGVDVAVGAETSFIGADEVIVSAGAVETPRLLQRSGIGDASALPPDVRLVADSRGVGRGLSDHPALDIAWEPRPGVVSAELHAAWTAAWNAPAGEVADAGVELLLAAKPTAAILSGRATAVGPLDLRITLAEPLARGRVTAELISYDYLSRGEDVAALRAATRAAARMLRSEPMRGVVASDAVPEWVDSVAHHDAAEQWIRSALGTALHSCGTARMGDGDDPDAVTDAHGRVHGATGLRVADASLLPAVPSRGTALTAVFVGERVAELIASE